MKLLGVLWLAELRAMARRPSSWVLLAFGLLFAWAMFQGSVVFVGAVSGGLGEEDKVHVNGPYSLALYYLIVPFVLYTLFGVLALASTVARDRGLGVEEVLRSGSRLSARQYVLGKFLGSASGFLGIVILLFAAGLLFDSVAAQSAAEGGTRDPRLFGAMSLWFHIAPLLYGTLPWLLFSLSGAFYVGVRSRSTLAVYGTLVFWYVATLFLAELDFAALRNWSLDVLGIEWKYVLGWLDPSGFSFLQARYAGEDRGVAFYNEVVPLPDLGFAVQRLLMVSLAVVFVARAVARYARQSHGSISAAAVGAQTVPEVTLPVASSAFESPPSARRPTRFALGRVALSECSLLLRQGAVWIFAPLIAVAATTAALLGRPGPWGSSEDVSGASLVAMLSQELSVWLCALAVFLTVESLQREKAARLQEIWLATPLRARDLVLGKWIAVCLVVLWMGAVPVLLSIALQPLLSPVALDRGFVVLAITVLVAPAILFFAALAAFVTALTRSRTNAFAAIAGFAVLYLVGLLTGWLDWRGHVVPTRLMALSDLLGLAPYRVELVLNRALVLSATGMLLLLTVLWYPRTDRPRLASLRWPRLRRQSAALAAFFLFGGVAIAAGVWLDQRMDRGLDAKWREDRSEEYARRNRVKWGMDREVPEFRALDLDLRLEPARRWFRVEGNFTLYNAAQEHFSVVPLTVGADWDRSSAEFAHWITANGEEQPAEFDDRAGLLEFRLPQPLAPGGSATLRLRYEGSVAPGSQRNSGALNYWIFADSVFLDSFAPVFLPVPGYREPEDHEEDTLDEGLSAESMARAVGSNLPALLGGRHPYSVRLAIHAPEELVALSVGRKVADQVEHGMRTTVFESDHPVYFFPVVLGHYTSTTVGKSTVYYHEVHPHNVDTIAKTLDQARRFYDRVFAPYPFQDLRLVELPAFATFALGHPTLIPFGEQLGFLTRGQDGISNTNFMVTAHEVAHQWWGTVVTPARAPAAPFLTEALAHFSTILMEERFQGRVAARNRRRQFEKEYLDGRHVDVERPIVRIDGSQTGDTAIWYNKGGLVFWMAFEHFGRERFLRALQGFCKQWSFQPAHPTLHDLLLDLRADASAEDIAFLDQWFYRIDLPKPEVTGVFVRQESGAYRTRIGIANRGTGTVPVVVELANRRLRTAEPGAEPRAPRLAFDDLPDPLGDDIADQAEQVSTETRTTTPSGDGGPTLAAADDYQAVRGTVLLKPGEEAELVLETSFEPHAVLLDPDVDLLMLGRPTARREF